MARSFILLTLFVACAGVASAQLDSDSLTVRVSRPVAVQPDVVRINVYVTAPPGAGLDEILSVAQGAGVSADNVAAVYSASGLLRWVFAFRAPAAKLKDALAAIGLAQQNAAKKGPGLNVDFAVQGADTSVDLRQLCPVPGLMADARAQAEQLAGAAGLAAGPVLAIWEGLPAATPSALGGRAIVTFALPFPAAGFSATPPAFVTCALLVKFRLLRYQ